MKSGITFGIFFIMSCFLKEGLSLRCWNCRSDTDPSCADPFNNATLPLTYCETLANDLTIDHNRCRKVVKKENGEWVTFRSCGRRTDPEIQGDEPSCTIKSENNMQLCVCSKLDGCNISSIVQVLPLLMVFTISFIFIFNFV
nr:protein quiver-like [Leptinotarsa decemlineata]